MLDNSLFAETGGQATHTAGVTNLATVARGCGIPAVCEIKTMQDVLGFADQVHNPDKGLTVAIFKISPELMPRVMVSRAGTLLVDRTRRALGLPMAV